jgi:hypothetical protein
MAERAEAHSTTRTRVCRATGCSDQATKASVPPRTGSSTSPSPPKGIETVTRPIAPTGHWAASLEASNPHTRPSAQSAPSREDQAVQDDGIRAGAQILRAPTVQSLLQQTGLLTDLSGRAQPSAPATAGRLTAFNLSALDPGRRPGVGPFSSDRRCIGMGRSGPDRGPWARDAGPSAA